MLCFSTVADKLGPVFQQKFKQLNQAIPFMRKECKDIFKSLRKKS